jgi:hypothetical protein
MPAVVGSLSHNPRGNWSIRHPYIWKMDFGGVELNSIYGVSFPTPSSNQPGPADQSEQVRYRRKRGKTRPSDWSRRKPQEVFLCRPPWHRALISGIFWKASVSEGDSNGHRGNSSTGLRNALILALTLSTVNK